MKLQQAVLLLLRINHNFRVEVPFGIAETILYGCEKYNNIPADIHDLPRAIQHAIGPVDFGNPNPNNGKFHNLSIKIGNKGSLVIYIESNTFYRVGDKPERQKAAIEAVAKRFKADEIDVTIEDFRDQDNRTAIIKARLWWD
jgi:hypothetical protein